MFVTTFVTTFVNLAHVCHDTADDMFVTTQQKGSTATFSPLVR